MREAALLQTFPKKYQFPADHGKTKVAELIGNALPPKFLKFHALEVGQALSRQRAIHEVRT